MKGRKKGRKTSVGREKNIIEFSLAPHLESVPSRCPGEAQRAGTLCGCVCLQNNVIFVIIIFAIINVIILAILTVSTVIKFNPVSAEHPLCRSTRMGGAKLLVRMPGVIIIVIITITIIAIIAIIIIIIIIVIIIIIITDCCILILPSPTQVELLQVLLHTGAY